VQAAVIDGAQVVLGYTARDRAVSTRVVHPLGVAAKGPAWYLVASTDAGLRSFRVNRITSVERNGQAVVRPEGFRLAEAWRLIADEVDKRRTPVLATARVRADAVGLCRFVLANRVRIGPAGDDGRVEVELRGHSTRSLAGELAGLGGAIEVVEPVDLRSQLAAIAAELVELYGATAVPDERGTMPGGSAPR